MSYRPSRWPKVLASLLLFPAIMIAVLMALYALWGSGAL
jgi:hypothetical protein